MPVIAWVAVVLVMAALAMPIKQRCGAPGRSCATAVDSHGNVHYFYEVEPLGILVLEHILGRNILVYYTSGTEVVNRATTSPGAWSTRSVDPDSFVTRTPR